MRKGLTTVGAGARGYERGSCLEQARAAGVAIVPDGENLMLTAPAPPPASVVTALGRHKAEVLALLRPGACGWSAEDWHAFFEKQAGIAALEARLPREEAEARAFACCVAEWLNRKLVQSPPGRCLGCAGSEHPHDKLLPFGTERNRPCLAAFALLARLARKPKGRGGRHPFNFRNLDMRTSQ